MFAQARLDKLPAAGGHYANLSVEETQDQLIRDFNALPAGWHEHLYRQGLETFHSVMKVAHATIQQASTTPCRYLLELYLFNL
jgi:hypothetical protein